MAVTHVAMFRWRSEVDANRQAAELGAALEGMRRRIPGLISLEYGHDLGVWPRTFDFALVARFFDQDALRAYGTHAAHQEVFRCYVEPTMEVQGSVQFDS